MRIKTGRGKPRLFEVPPKPSLMALNSLSIQLNSPKALSEKSSENTEANEDNSLGHCSIVQETYDDADQNTTCHKQTHVAIDNMAVAKDCLGIVPEVSDGGKNTKQTPNDMVTEAKCCGKVSENTNGQIISSRINPSEKKVCIKCDEGGKLLVCSNSQCPLAVHKECMRCSAHFDSKGKFFCPYCSYRQAVLTKRKAKKNAMLEKKALSDFLARGKVDCGPLSEKVDRLKSGERKLPENEEVVPCDGVTTSAINEENNVTSKSVNSGRTVDGKEEAENRIGTEQANGSFQEGTPKHIDDFQNKLLVGHDLEDALIGKKRMSCVEPELSFESPPSDGETEAQEGNQKIVNGFQNKKVKRHDQKALIGKDPKLGVLSEESMDESLDTETEEEENSKNADEFQNKASLRKKNRKLDVEPEKSMQGNLKNADIEKESTQDRGQESSGDDYSEENDEVASDSFDRFTKVDLRRSGRNKNNNKNATSTNGECSRQTIRKLSFEGDENKVQKENKRSKSRQQITNTDFPNAKRKRVPWTAEEEEMLKEGVGRFSSTGNINIPWRKILDFGRHVFHGTRTADNLKDKWRSQMK